MRDVTGVDEAAQHLLSCVTESLNATAAELENVRLGAPCRACVAPGEVIHVCPPACGHRNATHAPGQLTVSLVRMGPYTTFPSIASNIDVSCEPTGYAAELLVTLLRCAPSSSQAGPPACDKLADTAQLVHIDAVSIHRALKCCVPTRPGRTRKTKVAPTGHRVIGPAGGCVGNEVRVVIDLGGLCPCEAAS